MLVLASSSTDYLSCWKQALFGLDTVVQVSDMANLRSSVEKCLPRILLLDLELPGQGIAAAIRKLRKASPTTKIVVLGQPASDEAEVALFLAGARGCCPATSDEEVLRRVVNVVAQGEPWIRRSIMPLLLDRLVGRNGHGAAESLRQVSQVISSQQQNAAAAEADPARHEPAAPPESKEKDARAPWGEVFRKAGFGERLKMAFLMGSTQES